MSVGPTAHTSQHVMGVVRHKRLFRPLHWYPLAYRVGSSVGRRSPLREVHPTPPTGAPVIILQLCVSGRSSFRVLLSCPVASGPAPDYLLYLDSSEG